MFLTCYAYHKLPLELLKSEKLEFNPGVHYILFMYDELGPNVWILEKVSQLIEMYALPVASHH